MRSKQRVTYILLVILIATIYTSHGRVALVSAPSPEQRSDRVLACMNKIARTPSTATSTGNKRLSTNRVDGVLTNYCIVPDRFTPAVYRPTALPDVLTPVADVGVNESRQLALGDYYIYEDPLPTPTRFAPVYHATFQSTIMPTVNDLAYPARLIMPDIKWPNGVQLPISDTPSVSGLITLHASGVVSFVMHEQTHGGLSFDIAVHRAMQKASCDPAINYRGVAITVVAPYRAVFKRTGATINSTTAVHGSIFNDYH